ncbi:MAG: MFS transporter [Pyrinomonadaceae bacterium]
MLTEKNLKERKKFHRLAVSAMFLTSGALFANWVARIPAVQGRLALSEGALGLALLGLAVGALISMPVAGWIGARVGSHRVTKYAVLAYCATLPLAALAPNLLTLTFSLMIVGAANGALNVAMNTQAVAVEKLYRRPIMSSFHAVFSLGGMIGAIGGAIIASLNFYPLIHFAGVAALFGALALIASVWLLPETMSAEAPPPPLFAKPTKDLLALGVIALCVMLGEGAMADWSAVYLKGTLGTSVGVAAAGCAAFSLAMAAGRLAGDRMIQLLGPKMILSLGGILAATGLGSALFVAQSVPTFIGLACVGLGFSTIVPVVFSAAGRARGTAPAGVALAAVTTTGYFGFLIGPPIIGFAAELMGLRAALWIVVILSVLIAALSRSVGEEQTHLEHLSEAPQHA